MNRQVVSLKFQLACKQTWFHSFIDRAFRRIVIEHLFVLIWRSEHSRHRHRNGSNRIRYTASRGLRRRWIKSTGMRRIRRNSGRRRTMQWRQHACSLLIRTVPKQFNHLLCFELPTVHGFSGSHKLLQIGINRQFAVQKCLNNLFRLFFAFRRRCLEERQDCVRICATGFGL